MINYLIDLIDGIQRVAHYNGRLTSTPFSLVHTSLHPQANQPGFHKEPNKFTIEVLQI